MLVCLFPNLTVVVPPSQVDKVLRNPKFVSQVARERIEFKDIKLLEPNKWLNDEVINFYGALIQKRADEDMITTSDGKQKKRRDIHYFNSFFYEKLERGGYEKSRLARWTKKVRSSFPCDCNTWDVETMAVQINIFSKDIVIFPINIGNQHWVCGALNFKDMRIEYYDSLSPRPSPVVYKVSIRRFCTRVQSTDMLSFQ
jgi:sentrin-specific protease 1